MQIINKEIELYQQVASQVSLSKVWEALQATPHEGQKAVVEAFDNDDSVNSYVITFGRRTGKSFSTALIVVRELLIPYSNTILLSPSYKNSKIMFDEVIARIYTLKLPIKSINKNSFSIELENGAKFSSVTQTNVESALGSRLSLLVVDETQSVTNLMEILDQLLTPMMLDYGVKENGTLYASQVFLGTPRGVGTVFHELYLRELQRKNWKSFHSPSNVNPLLPKTYIQEQETVLPELVYKQEILALWVSTGAGVFHAFDKEVNLYDPETLVFDKGARYIMGFDFGTRDSTAAILVYVTNSGDYYVHDTYMKNMTTTSKHLEAYKAMESRNSGELVERFGDPSAAQTLLDLSSDYNYDIVKANNRQAEGIDCINNLLSIQGANKKPKMYINKNLSDLITQMELVTYNPNRVNRNADMFNKAPGGEHHWDLLAALRYVIYSHYRGSLAGEAILL